MSVISWNTTKTYNGNYAFRVYALDYQMPTQTLKEGCYPTRARAVGAAKRWTRHFKELQKALPKIEVRDCLAISNPNE